ncbi:hypothetical protein [Nocardiopsis sp. B62]|uniref:hypothetical protein n=1 Tax=Nocardiopsis sp. B62 TaxID=2824874 RepID=UPI001B361339|nr:hypothetical protein [Nocardiopsis sp. B62]MBQ1081992.1 hypothetical protein [Nocardiopsis sp. B62]
MDGGSQRKGSRNGELPHSWELDVHPLYRDGAFVVARFEATNEGDTVPSTTNPFGIGSCFEFSAFDPATGTVHTQAFDGEAPSFIERVGSPLWPAATAPGSTQYGYLHLAARPAETTGLTFDAGPFGMLEGIPIER